MKNWIKALAVVALAFTATGAAQAQTATTTFQVTANVLSSCTVAATNLAFGNYNAAAVLPLETTSTITVTCTNGEDYGVGVGATPMTRTMAGPSGSTLNYGMFSDNGYAAAFGFGATGATGTGAAQVYTVYGQVPAGQFAARAGAHSDTVNVTVTY
jgi:spore coat protein U-like protein